MCFARAHPRAATIGPVGHILIEMRRADSTDAFEMLDRFRSTDEELSTLRAVLEGREPFSVLDRIETPLVRDARQILKEDGYEARDSFLEDH